MCIARDNSVNKNREFQLKQQQQQQRQHQLHQQYQAQHQQFNVPNNWMQSGRKVS